MTHLWLVGEDHVSDTAGMRVRCVRRNRSIVLQGDSGGRGKTHA